MFRKTLKTVNICDLVDVGVQPDHREDELDVLMDTITDFGVLNPPFVVPNPDGTYTKGDGHRRVAASKALGHKTIEVWVCEGITSEGLFALLNRATKAVKSRDWFEAWAKSKDSDFLGQVPHAVHGQISLLLKHFPEDRVRSWGRAHYVASYVGEIGTVHRLAKRMELLDHSAVKGITSEDVLRWIFCCDISQHRARYRTLRSMRERAALIQKKHVTEVAKLVKLDKDA